MQEAKEKLSPPPKTAYLDHMSPQTQSHQDLVPPTFPTSPKAESQHV
jgi:hypothetical protein